jgi:hypothetical protein
MVGVSGMDLVTRAQGLCSRTRGGPTLIDVYTNYDVVILLTNLLSFYAMKIYRYYTSGW